MFLLEQMFNFFCNFLNSNVKKVFFSCLHKIHCKSNKPSFFFFFFCIFLYKNMFVSQPNNSKLNSNKIQQWFQTKFNKIQEFLYFANFIFKLNSFIYTYFSHSQEIVLLSLNIRMTTIICTLIYTSLYIHI